MSTALRSYLSFNTRTALYNDQESCMTDRLPFCNITEPNQFTKFVQLGVDGVAYLYIDDLRALFRSHSHEYVTYTTNVRYTSELHKTWFSGRDNNKLTPMRVPGETFFSSFRRKYGLKIHLYGSYKNFNNVLPTFHDLFWNITEQLGPQPADKLHSYNYWLTEENRTKFIQQLETWNENNVSLVSWSGESDNVQHEQGGESHYTNFSRSENIAKRLAQDLVFVKEWIDQHPDYLFIIAADHGHDEIEILPSGDERYQIHGGYTLNNTGWWIYYNPRFQHSERVMNVTDITPTWAKYIKNMDIPANAIGQPHTVMRYIRNEVKVRQQGLSTLWHLCRNTTRHCSGPVYDPSLSNPSLYFSLPLPHKPSLQFARQMVSFSADEAFPENVSVVDIDHILHGEWNQTRDGPPPCTIQQAQDIHNRLHQYLVDENATHWFLYDKVIISSAADEKQYAHVYNALADSIQLISSLVETVALFFILNYIIGSHRHSTFASSSTISLLFSVLFFFLDRSLLLHPYHYFDNFLMEDPQRTDPPEIRNDPRRFARALTWFTLFGLDMPILLRRISYILLLFVSVHFSSCFLTKPAVSSPTQPSSTTSLFSMQKRKLLSRNTPLGHSLQIKQDCIMLLIYLPWFYIAATYWEPFRQYLLHFFGNKERNEGFYSGHITVFSTYLLLYLLVIEVLLPLYLSHKKARGSKRQPWNLKQTFTSSITIPLSLFLAWVVYLFRVWSTPYGFQTWWHHYQPHGITATIATLLLIILAGLVPPWSRLSPSRHRISALPQPSAFSSLFQTTLSFWTAFSQAFSAYTPLFVPLVFLIISLFVMHYAHFLMYLIHLSFKKFIVLPVVGIVIKAVGSYLNPDGRQVSKLSTTAHVIVALEVFLGFLIIRIFGIYGPFSNFADFYMLGQRSTFDVDANNPWRGVETFLTNSALVVVIMALYKFGFVLFFTLDVSFYFHASLEGVGMEDYVFTQKKQLQTVTTTTTSSTPLHFLLLLFIIITSSPYLPPILMWLFRTVAITHYFYSINTSHSNYRATESVLYFLILAILSIVVIVTHSRRLFSSTARCCQYLVSKQLSKHKP